MGKDDRSPHEKWWETTIPLRKRVQDFRIWGCKAYPLVPKKLRPKGGDKAKVGVHLGYSERKKAYIVLDLATMTLEHATSVVFNETVFPLQDLGGDAADRVQVDAEFENDLERGDWGRWEI